jgi:hypothetical protein
LEKNPAVSGTPMMAAQAAMVVQKVTGMTDRRPPKCLMSVSSSLPCITEPAPRNSWALKKAWVTRWNMPAA